MSLLLPVSSFTEMLVFVNTWTFTVIMFFFLTVRLQISLVDKLLIPS
jgi:hypothetical protein